MNEKDNIFIFKLENNNNSFDYNYLSYIQDKIDKGLNDKETIYLLNWIIYRIKEFLPQDNISYDGLCGYAADLAVSLADSLNIKSHAININYILKKSTSIHAITLLDFKNNKSNKRYIIDPTFRQFLVNNECQHNKYIKINNINMKQPTYPGYYLNKTKEGKIFGTKLLNNGYFDLNEDNIKLYFDSILEYINNYHNRDINYGIKNGIEYIKDLSKCEKHILWTVDNKISNTPKQILNNKYQKKRALTKNK